MEKVGLKLSSAESAFLAGHGKKGVNKGGNKYFLYFCTSFTITFRIR